MIKNCQSCNTKFDGRRDAKTCSVRCRKRFQRAKSAILHEAGVLKQDVEQVIDTLKGDIIPVRLADVEADVSDEAGFIALEEQKQPYADSVWKPDYLDLPGTPTFNQSNNQSGNPPLVNTNPASASIPVVPEPAPVSAPPSPTPAVISSPVPVVVPQPTILSLEDNPTPLESSQPFLSSLAASAAPAPSLLSQVPASGSASPITPLPDSGQKESLKSKLQGRLRNTPLAANFAAIMVLILVGGVFAGAKLTHEAAPGAMVVNSESNTLVKQGDNILNINLDTVLANGKKLTLGQIVAGPGTSVLQVTGDVQSSGTLLASGGGSSLSNTGLKINSVVVCTDIGCTPSTATGLTAIPGDVTRQGNSFNGASQLVQLTGAGILPALSGANLTNLNASNIASGSLADSRLSANIALLNGSQTFSGNPLLKNTTDSTTAFRIQDVLGNNLLLVNTIADRVTIVGLQGSGANLTDLNASNISSGTLADGRLSGNVSLLGASIESSEITDGTIVNADVAAAAGIVDTKLATISTAGKVADSALSANVALLNGTGPQAFTGNNSFSGTFLHQNTANSATTFQVQNAAGARLLTVDSIASEVELGQPSSTTGKLVLYESTSAGSTTLQAAAPGAGAFVISLPAATGTVCLTTGNCAGVGGTGDILNNGNTFGAAVTLGTNDNFGLNLEVNNTTVGSFTNGGAALFKNSADSTAAFQVQNLAGNPYLLVNTTGTSISVGNTSIASTVQIGNTTGAVAQTIAIGNNATALSTNTVTIGNLLGTSATTIQGGTGASAVAIQAGASGTIAIGTTAVANTINIGDSLDTVTITGGAASTIVLNGSTISAAELNLLDGHDVALVDTNDAVATAITGTGALNAGSITNGFGAIDTGADNITTTGTVQGTTSVLTSALDVTAAGALTIGNTTATSVSICASAACDTVGIGNAGADADAINIGDSLDTLTLTGGAASTIVLNGSTISAAELNLLDGHDVALVDTNDAVATAITGTGALDAGSITANFGSINTGADNITTTGTVQGTTSVLTSLLDTTAAGTLSVGTATATAVNIGNATGTTAVSALCGTGTCGFGNNATDHSTIIGSATGTSVTTVNAGTGGLNLGNNGVANTVQIGNTTGAVAQTIAIGNNATALSTNTVTIGNLLGTSATLIQGGTGASAIGLQAGTSGTISVGTTNVNTVTIGSTSNTGTLTFGQATTGETINIGNGNVATGNTNTINIGATATTTGKNTITIGSTVAASSLILQGGTGTVALQSQSALGIGNNSVAQTLTIGNGTGATAVSVLCGSGTCGFGNNAVDHATTVGSATTASLTTLQGGTSGLSLKTAGTAAITINSTQDLTLGGTSVTFSDVNDSAIIGPSTHNLKVDAGSTKTLSLGTVDAGTVLIGKATATLTLTGSSSSTFVLNGSTISAAELNLLDGHDVALVDTNDAVATAITGTGALAAGSISANFGAIDTGADNITTTGTVNGNVLDRSTAGTLTIGTTNATSITLDKSTGVGIAPGNNKFYVSQANTTAGQWTGAFVNTSGTGAPDGLIAVVGQNSTNKIFAAAQNSLAAPSYKFVVSGEGNVRATLPNTQNAIALCHATNGQTTDPMSDALTDCSGAPSDIAEWYDTDPDVAIGEVVAPSGQQLTFKYASGIGDVVDPVTGMISQDAPLAGVDRNISVLKKATNASAAVGIVSTAPYQTFGEDVKAAAAHPQRIALTGRVPVRTTDEGGDIHPGDYLIVSPTVPGAATKATHAGPTIGKALSGLDTNSGTVLVLINLSYWGGLGSTVSDWQGGSPVLNSLVVNGDTRTATLTVTGNATFQGTVTIAGNTTVQGTLTLADHFITSGSAPAVSAESAAGTGATASIEGNDQAGTIAFGSGTGSNSGSLAKVTFHKVYAKAPRVILAPANGGASLLQWYVNSDTTSFELKSSNAAADSTAYSFNYWVIE